jgi:hypothetical protein
MPTLRLQPETRHVSRAASYALELGLIVPRAPPGSLEDTEAAGKSSPSRILRSPRDRRTRVPYRFP